MTLVLDASLVVDVLLHHARGKRVAPALIAHQGQVHLPHLADIETMSVLRGLVLGGVLTSGRATQAVADLRDFSARRWPAAVSLERIWQLRGSVTAYDASYVALAEALDAEFWTADQKLARALQGVARCEVTVIR